MSAVSLCAWLYIGLHDVLCLLSICPPLRIVKLYDAIEYYIASVCIVGYIHTEDECIYGNLLVKSAIRYLYVPITTYTA